MADTRSIAAWQDAVAYASAGVDPYPLPLLPPLAPLRRTPGTGPHAPSSLADIDGAADPWDPRRARNALAREVVPHQLTFASLYQAVNGLYATSQKDEALLNNRENAQTMWRDGSCWPLIEERKSPVRGLDWSIEPSDAKDPGQLKVAAQVTELVEETPDLLGFLDNLLDAAWFGAAGVELIPDPAVRIGTRTRWGVEDHFQVEGDKINWTWGRVPGIYVNGAFNSPDATVHKLAGNEGHVLLLDRPKWRDKFVIHTFQRKDFSYLYEPEKAIGAVGGVGLRGRLYWPWCLWKELQAWWYSGMETIGANGNWQYLYPHDNPAIREAMAEVARKQSRQVHVLVPVYKDMPEGVPGVRNIPPSNVKFELMQAAMEFLWRWMRAIVLGGNPEDNGDGAARGKTPEASEGQRSRLMRLDAKSLAETMTRQYLRPYLLKYNEWDYRKVRYPGDKLPFKLRWKFQIEDDSESNLAKLATAEKIVSIFQMVQQGGGVWPIDPEQVRDAGGFSAPRDEQKAPGLPPGMPAPGQAPGVAPGQQPPPGKGAAPAPNGAGRVPRLVPSNGMGNGKGPGPHDHAGGTGINRPHVQQMVGQAGAKPDRFARVEQPPTGRTTHVPTVAVDLDGTICEYDHWRGEDHFGAVREGAVEALADFRRRGFRIIIFTTRGNTGNVAAFLDREEIPYDFINENPDQPEGTSEKIVADVYIDDRAVDARPDWKTIGAETVKRLERFGRDGRGKPKRLARRNADDDRSDDPGVMIAWFLPADLAGKIALPDGEAPEELHVTLAYLGRRSELGDDEQEQREAIDAVEMVVAGAVAELGEPLEGTIGGLGQFPASESSEGREVVFVPVDVPGLSELRTELVRRLKATGFPVAEDHGFTPHVTLTYIEPDADIQEMPIVQPKAVTIDGLTVAVGDERREVAPLEATG